MHEDSVRDLLAMQKVEGSSPLSRSQKTPAVTGVLSLSAGLEGGSDEKLVQ
jgi:hypothetical protein